MARGNAKKTPGTPAGYGAQGIKAPPSKQYGEGVQTKASQAVVPLPDMSSPAPQAEMGAIQPGSLGPLNSPSTRPGEPITNGANFGSGPMTGELALPRPEAPERMSAAILKTYLPMLEAFASTEESTHELRSFVRRLRAQAPPTPLEP